MRGNMETSFDKDLERGQKIEKEILIEVKKKYDDAYLVDGYCKEWDIHIPSEDKGVEVKYDPMSLKTGNLVVEIEYNDKPSALSTTKAYRWVFHTGKEVITTTPGILNKVIEENKLQPVRFRGPGDPYDKKAYLIKKHLITATALQVRKIQ
tara:strand:- start:171 stop:623 length:453 start_codon:yes stop_codon:yes gene_type:complete